MLESTPQQPSTRRLLDDGYYLAILTLALLLRLLLVNSQSLTMDELFDLDTAHSGWQGILTAENRFPPLYHATLLCWWRLVPWDTTGRIFSALCGTALVGVLGLLGQQVGGRATGLWSSFLGAISPLALWYSLESRVYSLYLLLAAICLWQFALAIRRGRLVNWFCFGVASLAGVYTHYYFGLLLAISAFVFCWSKRTDLRALRTGLLVFVVLGLLCLPDLWFLREDLDQRWGFARTSEFSLPALGYTFFSFFSGYSLGPSLRELHQLSAMEALRQIAPWLIVLGVPVAVLSCVSLWQTERDKRLPATLLVVAFGVVPVLLVGLASLFASFGYNVRHALWCYPPLQLIVARGIAMGRPRGLAAGCAALLCASSLFAIWNHHWQEKYRHEDLRAAGQFLSSETEQDAPVFVLSGYMVELLNHYLPADKLAHSLATDQDEADRIGKVLAEISRHSPRRGKFMLVYTREFHGDPKGEVLQAIKQLYDLELVASYAGVRIYRGASINTATP